MLVTGNLYDCVKNKEVKIFIKKSSFAQWS